MPPRPPNPAQSLVSTVETERPDLAERKAQILREAGLWHDPPSYYAEGKFLQLAPEEEEADGAARASPAKKARSNSIGSAKN